MNPELFKIFECRDHRRRFEANVCLSDRNEFKNFSFFTQILDSISSRDNGKFTFQNENDDIFIFERGTQEYVFKEYIRSSETMKISLIIDKQIIDGKQSIYFLDSFIKHLVEKNVSETLSYFHCLFSNDNQKIEFEILDPNVSEFRLHTKSIYFDVIQDESQIVFNRASRLFKVKNTCSFYNQDKYELLPDDFHVTETFSDNENSSRLKKYFSRIEMILAVIYIVASSEIKQNNLSYQLNGTVLTKTINLKDNLEYNPSVYEIYNWIYRTDNYIDKSSITRSVFEYLSSDILDSDINVIRGVQKAYNIYIKDKVNVYLDAKKDLSDYIIDSLSTLKSYTNTILDTFLKNLYAIVGFFFSVILANAISDRELDKIFTRDILIIIVIALIGSFVFWGISNLKFLNDLQNFKDLFDALKKNYEEVLLDNELDTIFNNIQLENEINKVKRNKKIINYIWGGFLVFSLIIAIIVLLLFFHKK